jgi:hypothetical protein
MTTELYAKKVSTFFESESEDETTGIDSAIENSDSEADVWYDLNGRKLQGRPAHRGIYISQGKKVIVQ